MNPHEAVTTDDGVIFPLPRSAMRDPAAIRARMMRDIRDLNLPSDQEDFQPLKKLGWSASQLRIHFIDARNAVNRESPLRIGADALALLAFLAGIFALCSHFAGPVAV